MRGTALLTMLLITPSLLTAQVPETDNKPLTKLKPSSAAIPAKPGSALQRARAAQGEPSDSGATDTAPTGDEGTPDDAKDGEAADAGEARLPLAARLFLTHDPAAFQTAWKEGQDILPTARTIGNANPIMALVAVSGCARGKDGKCSIEFASRTAGPDGLFDLPRSSPPWKPAPPRGKPELAPASFGLRLGPADPPGRYTIEVTVTDLVADTQRVLTGTVTKPAASGGR